MKKLLLILLIIAVSTSIKAQWGIVAGLDETTFRGYDYAKYKTGFHVGATYDMWQMSEKLCFQSGLLFTLGGFKSKGSDIVYKGTVDMYALEVPLNFVYRIPLNDTNFIRINAGPYMRIGLFGDNKKEGEKNESSYKEYNRFDAGLNIGLYYVLNMHYYIGPSYQLGFTNAEKGISNVQNMRYRFSLGYLF